MTVHLDPDLERAIEHRPEVAAAHAEVMRLLGLVQVRPRNSQSQRAAIAAMQVAVQRRRLVFEKREER